MSGHYAVHSVHEDARAKSLQGLTSSNALCDHVVTKYRETYYRSQKPDKTARFGNEIARIRILQIRNSIASILCCAYVSSLSRHIVDVITILKKLFGASFEAYFRCSRKESRFVSMGGDFRRYIIIFEACHEVFTSA